MRGGGLGFNLSLAPFLIVKEVLESLIIKYQTRRWDVSRAAAKEPIATVKPATAARKRATHAAR